MLNEGWNWLVDALFPRRCLGCGRYGSYCCTACLGSLHFPRELSCPSCGNPSPLGAFCAECAPGRSLRGVWVAQHYGNHLVRELIHHVKYDGLTELATTLGHILVATLRAFDLPPAWHDTPRGAWHLTPVPLAPLKLRQRNFNQAAVLANVVHEEAGLPLGLVLARTRHTKPQNKLTPEERAQNVAEAFAVVPGAEVHNKTFILVDDVYTSGATLEACAAALTAAGAREVWGLTVAKG
jgi:ComF family protein